MEGIQIKNEDSVPRQPGNQPHKRRKPIVAFLLSLITPGLGQMYNGQVVKAIFFFVVFDVLITTLSLAGLFFTFRGLVVGLSLSVGIYVFGLIDAVRCARKQKEILAKPYNRWYVYLAIFLLCNFILTPMTSSFIKDNFIKAYKMASNSMYPNLIIGDHFIVNKRYFKNEVPKRGDVILFEYSKDPSKDFMKRIIALGGEKVEIVQNEISINDRKIEDPWGYHESQEDESHFGPVVVPKDSVFVLGDNRNNSQDSRHFGFVNLNNIKGKVLYVYWAKEKRRIGMEVGGG